VWEQKYSTTKQKNKKNNTKKYQLTATKSQINVATAALGG